MSVFEVVEGYDPHVSACGSEALLYRINDDRWSMCQVYASHLRDTWTPMVSEAACETVSGSLSIRIKTPLRGDVISELLRQAWGRGPTHDVGRLRFAQVSDPLSIAARSRVLFASLPYHGANKDSMRLSAIYIDSPPARWHEGTVLMSMLQEAADRKGRPARQVRAAVFNAIPTLTRGVNSILHPTMPRILHLIEMLRDHDAAASEYLGAYLRFLVACPPVALMCEGYTLMRQEDAARVCAFWDWSEAFAAEHL